MTQSTLHVMVGLLVTVMPAVTVQAGCPAGDLDGNCRVGLGDLAILAGQWLDGPCAGPDCADLTGGDGVNLQDLQVLAENWRRQGVRLYLNEYMAENQSVIADPDQPDRYPDWFEVYNAGPTAIDLGGMHVTDDGVTFWQIPAGFPEQTTIEPGGYQVLWADNDPEHGPLHVDFALNKGGNEFLALYDADGVTLIDSVWTVPLGPDQSHGRLPDGGTSWTVFSFNTATPPTPGGVNGGLDSRQAVVINEIMYHPYNAAHPLREELGEEYLELYNTGSTAVELTGWRLTDGVAFTFPEMTLPAGAYLVVAADTGLFAAKYPGVGPLVGGWEGRLSNSGERVTLTAADGKVIDSVPYADQGDWARRVLGPVDHLHRGWAWSDAHDGGGMSLELIQPGLPHDCGQNWAASTVAGGTPGAVNSTAAAVIAPVVADVEHAPAIPRASDPVTVSCRVPIQPVGLNGVTLHWRVDTSVYIDEQTYPDFDAGSYTVAAMTETAGAYTASIPPQPDGTIVEFYIRAEDVEGRVQTWPAPVDVDGTPAQLANALYQVDDDFDPAADWNPEDAPLYRIIMTRSEHDRLSDIGDESFSGTWYLAEPMSAAQMNGTFISTDGTGTQVRYQVGVRNRGNRSRFDPPMNYRVNFPNDHTWKGKRAINLNSKYPHVQIMGSALFRWAGLAANEAWAVRLHVNGRDATTGDSSRTQGRYAALEAYDGDWAENHFPDDPDGNLYRCTYVYVDGQRTVADLTYQGEDASDYEINYRKSTNEAQYDYSDVVRLTWALNDNVPDADYVAGLAEVLDLRQWARYLAADTLLGNQEGGLATGTGDDYVLYRGMLDPRFWLAPHDLDTVLGQGDHPYSDGVNEYIFGYQSVDGLDRFMHNDDVEMLFYQQLRDLLDTALSPEATWPLIDQLLGSWVDDNEINGDRGMKQFLVDRSSVVLDGGSPQVPRKSLTVQGTTTSLNGAYQLGGDFDPITTRSITINGRPVGPAGWDQRQGAWSGGNTGGGEITGELIVPRGSMWTYLDDGSDQGGPADGVAWYGHPDYDDGFWKGPSPAQLGYGDGDEATVVGYGPDSRNKYITTYFRRTFEVTDPSRYALLKIGVVRDDGVAVYLNGHPVPVVRDRLSSDFDYRTTAEGSAVGGSDEDTFFEFNVDPSLLQTGTNLLAAEVHQVSADSSDISFDVELEGFVLTGAAEQDVLVPGMNRLVVEAWEDANGTGQRADSAFFDVHYDNGSETLVTGTITGEPNEPGQLRLITRDSYLPGVPLLVRVELVDAAGRVKRDVWDATAVLSIGDNPSVMLSSTEVAMVNGVGTALVSCNGTGDFTLQVQLGGLLATKALADLSTTAVTTVSGGLEADVTWAGVVHVTGGDFAIGAGVTLTLQPGTLVLVDGVASGTGGTDIDVAGAMYALGTAESPVTITAFQAGQNWGELHFDQAADSTFTYTHITRAGRSPGVGHSGSGPTIRAAGSALRFEHCTLSDNAGKVMHITTGSTLTFLDSLMARSVMGPEISGTALQMEDSWVVEMRAADDADGIYIHGQQVGQECTVRRCVFARGDDDAMDTLGSEVLIEDCIVRDWKDKGISVYDGEVTVRGCLVVGNNVAPEDPTVASLAAKANEGATTIVHLDRTTVVTTRAEGVTDYAVQSHNKYGVSTGTIVWNITNSILDATDPIDVQTPYLESDVHVSYSNTFGEDWPGTGNLNTDPLFVNAAARDYRLQAGSLCVDAGDPMRTDPDGSRLDMGAIAYTEPDAFVGRLALWTPQAGPYRLSGEVVVPAGLILQIEPGTNVFFDSGARLTVRGRLIARGTAYRKVFFMLRPGAEGTWAGVQFRDTMADNVISHAVVQQARTTEGMIGLERSRLTLDQVWFGATGTATLAPLRRIQSEESSLIVRACTFTDMCLPGQAPLNNVSEHLWGRGVPAGGVLLVEGCTFGRTPGHNDAIDFDAVAGLPGVPEIRDNVFLGGGDDALDLETDAVVEGNRFHDYVKDAYNTDPQESNVISAGAGKHYLVTRNSFWNCQHAVQVKDHATLAFLNNTVVGAMTSAIYFGAPPAENGDAAYIDGCIFSQSVVLPETFEGIDVQVNTSILPAYLRSLGTDNLSLDPLLADPNGGDFSLRPGSPALGTGPWGLDRGAGVPGGVVIASGPHTLTHETTATFTLGGCGITAYRWRLDDGTWSGPAVITEPLVLAALADGPHTLTVIGQNAAGTWQDPAGAATWSWTVQRSLSRVLLHEVLARPLDGDVDFVELYNDSVTPVSLAGMSLSDDPTRPGRYVFDASATIGPGGYLVVYATDDQVDGAISLGFGLSAEGGGVHLYDAAGTIIDTVSYGPQARGYSIGRVGVDRHWTLTRPTPGQVNTEQPVGDASAVRINEWLAAPGVWQTNDWLELINTTALPVALEGWFLTDHPVTQPRKDAFDPLTFIEGFGYLVVQADDREAPGHVSFGLSADGELVALVDAVGREVDKVLYTSQTRDISQGRVAPEARTLVFFTVPTPGRVNLETVVINEVLAHSHAAAPDWIEVYNASDETIDLGGWWLSDDERVPDKYTIAAGTTLESGAYAVFSQEAFGDAQAPGCRVPFALSEGGDAVYLTAARQGRPTGYRVKAAFGASATGVSFGRHTITNGDVHFVAMAEPTPGGANSGPQIGPVVLTEIFYNPGTGPDDQEVEFIELMNISVQPVALQSEAQRQLSADPSDVVTEMIPWRMSDGVQLSFASNTWLAAGARLVLVRNAAAFAARFDGVPGGVAVIEWAEGGLNNDGEAVELSLPGDKEWQRDRYWIRMDRVAYADDGPWPAGADGTGLSLMKTTPSAYGDDPSAWTAATPTPGW